MFTLPALTDLYHHMQWADAAVWTSVLASEDGPTDAQLRESLYHLHVVQRAFLRAWRGEPRETPYPTFADAVELARWARSYYDEVLPYLAAQEEEKLAEPMPLAWASMVEQRLGRAPHTTSIGDTLLQVTLHSLYHRGQVNARLRQIGGTPPLVDYIAWVWLGRPAAEWPTETA